LGDTAAAETEYRKFLYGFPDSPLVHAATERIARMHGGNLPAVDMTAWKHAQTTALSDQRAEARNEAMCGPDCVAELLRRHGISVGTGALARKMGTSERGTSLAALAVALERRGLKTQGLKLDEVGLARQKLPIIALLAPGHYVIVDRVGDQSVSLWDPDGKGLNIGGPKTFSLRDWRRSWQGIALRMDGTVTANQATIATSVVRPSNGI
jgi:ABC-type bacteriocin/lantibiotic exporter with double-glycine peptidase domain